MINFALGIHTHQPVDNFDFVFERVYQQAYRPFLETVREYDAIRLNVHISGSLLEWLITNHPEHVDVMKELVSARRVEILTSGYYEPILTLLPEPERILQITTYSDRLADVF